MKVPEALSFPLLCRLGAPGLYPEVVERQPTPSQKSNIPQVNTTDSGPPPRVARCPLRRTCKPKVGHKPGPGDLANSPRGKPFACAPSSSSSRALRRFRRTPGTPDTGAREDQDEIQPPGGRTDGDRSRH